MKLKLMKLRVKVNRPPVSIFEMHDGKKEIDRTHYFEHGWDDAEHLFWNVPDGQYMICQGSMPPCICTIRNGKIKSAERNGKPAGNNVEQHKKETTYESRHSKETKNDVGGIMHVHNGKPKPSKKYDIVIDVVDTGADVKAHAGNVTVKTEKTEKP